MIVTAVVFISSVWWWSYSCYVLQYYMLYSSSSVRWCQWLFYYQHVQCDHIPKLLFYYLCQVGYVFVVVCLSVCWSVCLLATLCKSFQTDLRESFREGWQWAIEQVIKFWWWSGSLSGYRDCFPDLSLLWYELTVLRNAAEQGMH